MEKKTRQRISLSVFFFLSGLCYSSWASRIPTIKTALNINDAELGSLLFIMPISSLVGLPISGWLVSRFDSRWPLFIAFLFHASSLFMIGQAGNIPFLIGSMIFFAFFMRIFNIAMNTQSITLQKNYDKKINGSFHGLWSLGGIAGVGFTTLMIALNVSIQIHLLIIALITLTLSLVFFRYLIQNDRAPAGNSLKMGKPDTQLLILGFIVMFTAICEGGMFDWSGVYFKEVIGVELFTFGYLIFMICMTMSRFISDFVVHKIGMKPMYKISSLFITGGIAIAIIFPTFWPALIGFSMVGLGTAAVVPMTFILAGTSKKYSPGIALSVVVTYAQVGILLGPVIIGYLAHAVNLRLSFLFMATAGLAILPVSRMYFRRFGNSEV